MFKKLSFFTWFWFILNAGCALLLLLSYLSIYVDPLSFWPMAFIGLAYPFLIVFNLFFVIFWALKLHRFVALSSFVLLIGWFTHQKTIHFDFSDTEDKEKTPNAIRVMTYNAHFFQPFNGDYDAGFKREMLQVIYEQQPDVLCMQEFYTRFRGEFNILDSLIKKMHYKHFYFDKAMSNTYSQQGVVIFSKYPIKKRDHLIFNDAARSSNRGIYVDLSIGDQTIRVFNVHLQSISFQPEDYRYLKTLKKELDIDEQSTRNIGARLKRAFKKRSQQAKMVAEAIEKSPYPVIVCGDFNDTPLSFAYHTIAKGMKNSFEEKGKGYGRTYSGAFPNFQIDYVLCGKDFEVLNHRIIKKALSDHFPVRSDLLLH